MESQPTVAYFSMEIGLDPAIPTYSGGLGMLAGDSLRAAADGGFRNEWDDAELRDQGVL